MTSDIFSGSALRVARQFSGFSQAELGERTGTSRQYVHQLEAGDKVPNKLMRAALAAALSVDKAFFSHGIFDVDSIGDDDCHFRKLKTTPKWLVQQTKAYASVFERVLRVIEENLELPEINFPSCAVASSNDIEMCAENAREYWGLSVDQPIKNMTRVIENAGGVVVTFPGVSEKVDALSLHRRRPIVVRSSVKESGSRLRFDLAHECGHLIMHRGVLTGDHVTERQADRFASAFLLPRGAFHREFPRMGFRLDWKALYEFKQRWNVSVQAIVRRAYDLGLFDASQYKRACVHISKTGQRKHERFESELERPETLLLSVKALTKHLKWSLKDWETVSLVKGESLRRLLGDDGFNSLQAISLVKDEANVIAFPKRSAS